MTTRDELVSLIREVLDQTDPQYGFPADDTADAILSRWRIVPVEEAQAWNPYESAAAVSFDSGPGEWCVQLPGTHQHFDTRAKAERYAIRQGWNAQHRAADELTQHDQAAGHYADQAEERFVNANEDDAPSSSESVYGFRTDQHGPHED